MSSLEAILSFRQEIHLCQLIRSRFSSSDICGHIEFAQISIDCINVLNDWEPQNRGEKIIATTGFFAQHNTNRKFPKGKEKENILDGYALHMTKVDEVLLGSFYCVVPIVTI